MIFVHNTPNNTGIAVNGDFKDFEQLYEALHTVVGEEGEFRSFEAARLRVLGVCYDLRHALMGDREVTFVQNGMDGDKMKRMSTITHDRNVYWVMNVLWPEMLFVSMALNDFVQLYAQKISKSSFDIFRNKQVVWNAAISSVRMFQAAVAQCIKDTVSEASFRRMINLLNKEYTWCDNYVTQYVDVLNCRFLELSKDKRLKSILTMAKRLAEKQGEYLQVEGDVLAAAKHHQCPVEDIGLEVDYPDDIVW